MCRQEGQHSNLLLCRQNSSGRVTRTLRRWVRTGTEGAFSLGLVLNYEIMLPAQSEHHEGAGPTFLESDAVTGTQVFTWRCTDFHAALETADIRAVVDKMPGVLGCSPRGADGAEKQQQVWNHMGSLWPTDACACAPAFFFLYYWKIFLRAQQTPGWGAKLLEEVAAAPLQAEVTVDRTDVCKVLNQRSKLVLFPLLHFFVA